MRIHRAISAMTALLVTLLGGCGPEPGVAGPGAAREAGLAESDVWSAPVNLGATVNSPFVDFTPELSPDGLSLYFSSNRPGGSGGPDLWVARRPAADAPWEAPVNLGPALNSPANDGAPHVSLDGHRLYFTSNRPGGSGDNDVWVSWRNHVHDDSAWEPPVNLGPNVNGPSFEAGANLWSREFYFTSDRASGGGPLDIFRSLVGEGGVLGAAVLVAELSSEGNDLRPSIRLDGREIFLSSDRAGSTAESQDIWVAHRQPDGSWSTPANLGPAINSGFLEQQPELSADGQLLFLASNRPGGSGGLDLYVARRMPKEE